VVLHGRLLPEGMWLWRCGEVITRGDGVMAVSSRSVAREIYITDQGSPCPLVALNPFGRELLLSDGSLGFKRSTWIQRIL
jgi:hypothetical protein